MLQVSSKFHTTVLLVTKLLFKGFGIVFIIRFCKIFQLPERFFPTTHFQWHFCNSHHHHQTYLTVLFSWSYLQFLMIMSLENIEKNVSILCKFNLNYLRSYRSLYFFCCLCNSLSFCYLLCCDMCKHPFFSAIESSIFIIVKNWLAVSIAFKPVLTIWLDFNSIKFCKLFVVCDQAYFRLLFYRSFANLPAFVLFNQQFKVLIFYFFQLWSKQYYKPVKLSVPKTILQEHLQVRQSWSFLCHDHFQFQCI